MIPGTHELNELALPHQNKIVAFAKLAPEVWVTIALVWIVFALSVAFSFEVPASGAVLVGGALVGEMLFEQLGWRRLPCGPEGWFFLVPDAETRKPIAQNQYCIAPAGDGKLGALLSLSRIEKVRFDAQKTAINWYYKDAAREAEKVIFVMLVATAVCGTLIWGYGHRIF